MNKRLHSLAIVVAMGAAAITTACAVPAHAKSPSRSSFSSPSRVAPRPMPVRPAVAPAPRVVNRTTNNTTVIRETRVVRPVQQGSGFMGNVAASALGAVGGSMLGNWLSRPSEPTPVQQAPVQPLLAPPVEHAQPACDATIYNCEKKVK